MANGIRRAGRTLILASAVTLSALLGLPAGSPWAQNVQYHGKLQIGYGDASIIDVAGNFGIPFCAAESPGLENVTVATLQVNAQGTQLTPGPGGELVFHAVGAGHGGAQVRPASTCRMAIPGFANPRLRSRTRVDEARWPGNKGGFMTGISMLTSPASPVATYRLAAGGGIPIPGSTLMADNPIFGGASGALTISRGANHFGGGVPYQGGGGVQIGLVTPIGTVGSVPTSQLDFGFLSYFEAFVPGAPYAFGDSATGPFGLATTPLDYGLHIAHRDQSFAFRTPGGTTREQHGAIRTLGGGNSVTPGDIWLGSGAPPPCVSMPTVACTPIVSPLDFDAAFFAWTTGRVRITDRLGDFTTVRSATGFDVAATGPAGTTRRLQVVSPFSASVEPRGVFGFPVPGTAISGLAVLTLNVIPAPEPLMIASLGTGVVGLGLLVRRRSRKRG